MCSAMRNDIDEFLDRAYRERFAPATEVRLLELESQMRVPLPPVYRNFLATYNGGEFANCYINYRELDEGRTPHNGIVWLQQLDVLPASAADNAPPRYRDLSEEDDTRIHWDDEGAILRIGQTIDASGIYVSAGGDPEQNDLVLLVQSDDDVDVIAESIDDFFDLLECRDDQTPAES